ncbi:MAG: CheR family methyltransferase [bacterium]
MTASLSDDDLARVSDFVAERMGLHFPPERWAELRCGLEAARIEFGFDDAVNCARWMMSATLDLGQINVLASYLTIGETYFFRQKDLFTLLEEQILPSFVSARRGKVQRLRLWSVGCCTGEEAYSLAILVHRLIPDLSHWNITILASDINLRFLQKAQAGEFREWSFRNAPDWLKERYFSVTGTGQYAIAQDIRKMVIFSPLNLVEDTYPSLLNDTNAMDLILCRNVLMYFAPEQAEKVVGKLALALTEGGWLAVSPCESYCVSTPGLVRCGIPGASLFKKSRTDQERPESVLSAAPVSAAKPPGTSEGERPPCLPGNEYESMAQELANQGKLEEALTWCGQALAANPLDPTCHYLRAVILSEQGNVAEAARAYHRCIFIAPDFVLAHFAMGNTVRQQQKHHDACRHYGNALRLLRQCEPEDIVPHSEGLTAGRLTDMIASLMEVETQS